MWLGEGKQLQGGSRGSQVVGTGAKAPGRVTAFRGALQAKGGRTVEVGAGELGNSWGRVCMFSIHRIYRSSSVALSPVTHLSVFPALSLWGDLLT